MRGGRRLVVLLIASAMVGAAVRLPSVAAQGTCLKGEGQMMLERATDGCSSPVDLCLKGTVAGKGGFLDGATWLFTAGARTPSEPGVSYTGRTVITARTGKITTSTEASLGIGTITLVDRVAGADVKEPRLMGAREIFNKGIGVMSTRGSGGLERGFQAEVSGEICLSK
jgi:hypothetical protein